MIQRELLAAKGTGIGIVALAADDSQHYQTGEVADKMGLAESTTKERVESLTENGVLVRSAVLVDGEPTSVFSLTEEGETVAEELESVLEIISPDLLFSKGTGPGIVALSQNSDPATIESVANGMKIATGTAQKRVKQLDDAGIIEQSAQLIDDEPTRVFSLTDEGDNVAEHLSNILE